MGNLKYSANDNNPDDFQGHYNKTKRRRRRKRLSWIVFLNPNKVQTKRLKYVAPEDKLKATFTFEGNPIKVGDKFLACLVAVDGGVEIENATFKIQKNSPQNKPEVVNF